MPCRAVAIWFQALFTPRLGVLFSFPSRYIVRYRSWDVFRIGSRCLPASRPISNGRYSGDMTSTPLGAYLRGFNPLRRWHSSQTSTHSRGELYVSCPPINTTFPPYCYGGFGLSCAAFIRHYSRHRMLLSFPPPTKMFQFGGFPLPWGSSPLIVRGLGGPIRRSWVPRMHAPRPGLSQLATTFLGAQAEPSPRWHDCSGVSYDGSKYSGFPCKDPLLVSTQ